MSERTIINTIAGNLGNIELAWAGAEWIPEAQLGSGSGYVDLLAFPTTGPHRVVLVEAKKLTNPESSAKVVGQLLKYYAHARRLGRGVVERLRARAQSIRQDQSKSRWSLQELLHLKKGESLQPAIDPEALHPHEVALVIGLDGYHDQLSKRLGYLVSVLGADHGLPIYVAEVADEQVKRVNADRLLGR